MADPPPELAALRAEIAAVDRTLLDALNHRLELVSSVRAHKDATNVRFVDAERESALLRELASVNRGPLSERGVNAIFSAVLDVMKQELQADRPPAPVARQQAVGVERLAIIGTGLLGTSVGLAAARAGVASIAAFDADSSRLRQAATRAALQARSSVEEAVRDAQLVVVAVPVGSAVATIRDVLDGCAGRCDCHRRRLDQAHARGDVRRSAIRPRASRCRRRDEWPGSRDGGVVRRRHLVPHSRRERRLRSGRRPRTARDRARSATGSSRCRRARPAARPDEPPAARARERAHARRGWRGRGSGVGRCLVSRDDEGRRRQHVGVDRHLPRERRPDRRSRRGAPNRARVARARAGRAAIVPSSSVRSPRRRKAGTSS